MGFSMPWAGFMQGLLPPALRSPLLLWPGRMFHREMDEGILTWFYFMPQKADMLRKLRF